ATQSPNVLNGLATSPLRRFLPFAGATLPGPMARRPEPFFPPSFNSFPHCRICFFLDVAILLLSGNPGPSPSNKVVMAAGSSQGRQEEQGKPPTGPTLPGAPLGARCNAGQIPHRGASAIPCHNNTWKVLLSKDNYCT